MIVLGIDPSLSAFGWAVHDTDSVGKQRRVDSGHISLPKDVVDVYKYTHIREVVNKIINEYGVCCCGIESPAYGGDPFQTTHHTLMIFSLESMFNNRKDCVLFDPSTVKFLSRTNSICGPRVMDKSEMQRVCQIDTLDSSVIDNNEADAYMVAKHAGRFFSFKKSLIQVSDLNTAEKHVFIEKVKKSIGGKKRKNGLIFKENANFFLYSNVPIDSVRKSQKDALPHLSSESGG